jgi:hypothetical protein
MKRGRTSAAELSVVRFEPAPYRVAPPADLIATESELFRRIVADCSPDHFVASDTPLLVSYVQATLIARNAAKALAAGDGDALAVWSQAARMQATLATRLRLAPQARTDPKTLARRAAAHRPSYYDTMDRDDDHG